MIHWLIGISTKISGKYVLHRIYWASMDWDSRSFVNYLKQIERSTVYPKKYAHGFVVLCFVVVMQSFIMNSHEVFIHIHQGCFAGTGAIVRLPQCQWSKPDGYGKISQCITTTKHSKAKTVCMFLGIYCRTIYFQQALSCMLPVSAASVWNLHRRVRFWWLYDDSRKRQF